MQPDFPRIEKCLLSICEKTIRLRQLNNRTHNWLDWAVIDAYHPASQKEGAIRICGDPEEGSVISAHATMASKTMETEIFQQVDAILEELVKAPLLNYSELEFRVVVKKPNESSFPQVEITMDNFKLGHDDAPVEKVCKSLSSILSKFSEIPEGALQGPMRKFTCREAGSSEVFYAPSPEAMALKRFALGWKTSGVMEFLDAAQINENMKRMFLEQKAAS